MDLIVIIIQLSAIAVALMVAIGAHRVSKGRPVGFNGFIGRWGTKWGNHILRNQKQAPQPEPSEVSQDFWKDSYLEDVALDSGNTDDPIGQLEAEFARYKDGEISIGEYKEFLEIQRDNIRDEITQAKEDLKDNLIDSDDCDELIEVLRENMDDVQWRLDWARQKFTDIAVIPDWLTVRKGKWARFAYTDSEGRESKRTIVNWFATDRYVKGYDKSIKAERTFRLDRIDDWLCG